MKRLNAGMKFRTGQTQIFNGPLHFFDSGLAFMRINAGKANKLLRIALNDSRNVIVAQRRQASSRLCVPGEQNANHIKLRIIGGDMLNIFQFDLGTKIAFSGLCIWAKCYLHKLRCWQMDMKVDSPWHSYSSQMI